MHVKKLCRTGLFFFLLVIATTFQVNAQKENKDDTTVWKKVDELVSKGLSKSAITEVDKIYKKAKNNNDQTRMIKSLLYRITLQQNIEENAAVKSMDTIEREISFAKEPAKSILESILAQMYWSYFQQNRYRFYNRTNTTGFSKKDIATWTVDDLHKKIGELYLFSINDKDVLQKTTLEQFDPILIKGNVRYLRPTLYDLLAHRALDYFISDERDITKPAYAFEIKDKEVFSTVSGFIQHKFYTKDSASLHYKALLIYQEILAFHRNDAKPDALIDADIERINFANQYGVMEIKDEMYLKALNNISNNFSKNPASAQAAFLAAQLIYNSSSQSQNKNASLGIYSIRKAKEMLDEIVRKFPGSEGANNAQNLLKQILHPELILATEKVNVPGLPFRTLVTYKNENAIYFRVFPLTPESKSAFQNIDNDKLFQKLVSEKSIREWKQDLPKMDDYLSHSTEVKADPLPVGEYVLLGSASPDFSLNKTPLAAEYIYVSNISFINSRQEYFALDRTTGQPLEGASIQVYYQNYNYNNRNYQLNKKESLTADAHGYFKISAPKKNENASVRLDITYNKDRLFLDDLQYTYNYYNNEVDDDYDDQKDYDEENAKVFLFTDRSIYRPGQTVYFKGIGVTKNRKTKKTMLLQSKDSLTVFLSDANGQKIDSLKVLLNDFGTCNGKFRLPENKLNGEFDIDFSNYNNSSISFSVEEYKRPKFYAEFEKVKKSYRVGDTVSITGFAKAYAGNAIDGAKVSFIVTRKTRFIYPWIFWRTGFPRSSEMEITNGEIITNADGKFIIKFPAIADLSLDKYTDPVFDYEVQADITDLNGETRSTSTTIPIGYRTLNVQIGLPQGDIVNRDSLHNMIITSKNLSDQPERVEADVKIFKLQPPQRLIRKRLWSQPDTSVFTKDQYIQYFPNDEFKDELEKESWPKVDLEYEKIDSTNTDSTFIIAPSSFPQGWYVIEATAKDRYGLEVRNIKYFQVYDKKNDSLPAPSYIWGFAAVNYAEPGDTAILVTGSSAENIFLVEEINNRKTSENRTLPNDDDQNQFRYFSLQNDKKYFAFNITESDRGGFGVNQFFVKDNRFYVTTNNIFVPWTNKDLHISFDTYRDKTLPGSEEKWEVSVSGYKGENVAAEMLASMYDASLDQFKPHSWNALDIWPTYYISNNWSSNQNFSFVQSFEKYWSEAFIQQREKNYDALNYFNYEGFQTTRRRDLTGAISIVRFSASNVVKDEEVIVTGYGSKSVSVADSIHLEMKTSNKKLQTPIDQSQMQIRKNFNETAFFYPDLRTDKDGNISFSFTMPEALTQWKLMTLAHTKALASGYAERTVITQKDLMLQPNALRFFREGDTIEFSAKIVNLSDRALRGSAEFHLLSASTMKPADGQFKNISPSRDFTVAAGQSTLVTFKIDVPENFNDAVVYRIVAKAGEFSDGEEAAIPVVTNRMLVTETLPLPMRGDGTRDFKFEKLINSGESNTLTNYGLAVEYTTNPAWYAIQALPYLMQYPFECTEQTFNRYYANSLAAKIINSSPKIKAIFEKWKTADTAALMSNLQKNEELKSVLLQETPWVLQAQNEEQQKKNIALLFDMAKMSLQLESAMDKLTNMQSPNGGFVWFKGGPDDRYITQYIITGIGHLRKLDASAPYQQNAVKNILNKAIPYLDMMMKDDYDNSLKYKPDLKANQLSDIIDQYLYMRSFYPDYSVKKNAQIAYNFYKEQSKKYWLSQSKYMQAMLALAFYRTNDKLTAKAIIKSLQENSINNEELGMYWKEWNRGGYWWYQAPIESQALMIEAFSEIEKDPKTIDDLKTWLLKNKQTNTWNTTKATAEACYALLLQGTDLLSQERTVTIKLGNSIFNSKDEKQESGTGYFKGKIEGNKVNPEMGNISVTVSLPNNQLTNQPVNQSASWGSVYWQYFENLDKITFSETPLKLSKKLFLEKNSERGPVLVPINDGDKIHIGDKIKVRIELRVDRDMEYVHMKDMRASCMEPTNVISVYKYQDGVGYYETTKDVSTNFFFGYVNKGTYVFEYPMFVTHSGNFSNGITTIQCMYAPEFTSHSEGVRVQVEPVSGR